ncbi:MAG: translation initiation factor IF-5A [archaeon]
MILKIIDATEIRGGTNIIIEGTPYTVKKIDISKTGKHGHAKARIEAIGILSDQKKIIVAPGHERFEVPMVEKNKGQILSIGERVSLMNLDSFETLEVACEDSLKQTLKENDNVEYWDVCDQKMIKRKI